MTTASVKFREIGHANVTSSSIHRLSTFRRVFSSLLTLIKLIKLDELVHGCT